MKHILLALFLITSTAHGALTKVSQNMRSYSVVRADTSSTVIAAGGFTKPIFTQEREDTENLFTLATSTYTCPDTRQLEIAMVFTANAATGTAVAGNVSTITIYKNAVTTKQVAYFVAIATTPALRRIFVTTPAIIDCVVGDAIDFSIYNPDSAFTLDGTLYDTWITIKRIK